MAGSLYFPKCGYLHHRHFFHLFVKKESACGYISILSVNSEYMPSNVCLYRDIECIYELSFMFYSPLTFRVQTESLYKTLNQLYIYHYSYDFVVNIL